MPKKSNRKRTTYKDKKGEYVKSYVNGKTKKVYLKNLTSSQKQKILNNSGLLNTIVNKITIINDQKKKRRTQRKPAQAKGQSYLLNPMYDLLLKMNTKSSGRQTLARPVQARVPAPVAPVAPPIPVFAPIPAGRPFVMPPLRRVAPPIPVFAQIPPARPFVRPPLRRVVPPAIPRPIIEPMPPVTPIPVPRSPNRKRKTKVSEKQEYLNKFVNEYVNAWEKKPTKANLERLWKAKSPQEQEELELALIKTGPSRGFKVGTKKDDVQKLRERMKRLQSLKPTEKSIKQYEELQAKLETLAPEYSSASTSSASSSSARSTRDEKKKDSDENYPDDFVPESTGHGKKQAGKGLTNIQIDSYMRKRCPNYVGCIARDEVKLLVKRAKEDKSMNWIMNLDPASKAGYHWVAVNIDADDGSLEYFDPFGVDIPKDILKSIKPLADTIAPDNLLKLKVNRVTHQAENNKNGKPTDTCGFHCMRFLLDRNVNNKTFKASSGYDHIMENKSKKYEKEIERLKSYGTFKYL